MPRGAWGGFVFKVNVSTGALLSPICTGGCTNTFSRPRGSAQEFEAFLQSGGKVQGLNPVPAPGQSCGSSGSTEMLLGASLILLGWRHRGLAGLGEPVRPRQTQNKQLRECPRRWELCYNPAYKSRAVNSGKLQDFPHFSLPGLALDGP